MITIREEIMSPVMTKYHLDGLPFAAVLHHFTGPDEGDPHDHPFAFTSLVLSGGYVEHRYTNKGLYAAINHWPGDSFHIEATTIHKIIKLPTGDCWTLILPEKWERKSGFWQFRSDGIYFRTWDNPDWTLVR